MRAPGVLVLALALALGSCGANGIQNLRIDSILRLHQIQDQVHRSDLTPDSKRLFDEAVSRSEKNDDCYEIREGETVGDVISETAAYDARWKAWKEQQRIAARTAKVVEASTCPP